MGVVRVGLTDEGLQFGQFFGIVGSKVVILMNVGCKVVEHCYFFLGDAFLAGAGVGSAFCLRYSPPISLKKVRIQLPQLELR